MSCRCPKDEQVQSPAQNTGHSSVLPFPADAHGDAEGDLAEVELLPAPPRQENKQIPDTQQGQLCQNHQILLYFSSQLARPQHRERHKHSTETAQGFSLLTLGYSLHSTALWKTFQACLGGQRDRKTGVDLSSSPSPVPCTPTCTPADFQGLKITIPIPSQLTPHTTPGFLPWMEDSHLLLELPAHSAKEENCC